LKKKVIFFRIILKDYENDNLYFKERFPLTNKNKLVYKKLQMYIYVIFLV